jgi:hypothetical protein
MYIYIYNIYIHIIYITCTHTYIYYICTVLDTTRDGKIIIIFVEWRELKHNNCTQIL